MTTVYLLYYDTDYGNREEWNVSYTPIEVFTDEETRERRIEFIKKNYRDLVVLKEDVQLNTPWDSPLDNYDMDSEEDDVYTGDPISNEMAAFVEMKVMQLKSGQLNLSQLMSDVDFDRMGVNGVKKDD